MAWSNCTGQLDALFQDYLIHRGFNQTMKSFETDLKQEKTQQVEKIVQYILSLVANYDIDSLLAYWKLLETHLFCLLEDSYLPTVRKVEFNLYRLYIAACLQNGKKKECAEFFEKKSEELCNYSEWKEWFSAMYISHPENSKQFGTYFTKHWADTFILSLHNFMSVILSSMHPPNVVNVLNKLQTRENKVEVKPSHLKATLYPNENPNATTSLIKTLGLPGSAEEAIPIPSQQKKKSTKKIFPSSKSPIANAKDTKPAKTVGNAQDHSVVPPTQQEPMPVANPVKKSGYYKQRKELLGDLASSSEPRRSALQNQSAGLHNPLADNIDIPRKSLNRNDSVPPVSRQSENNSASSNKSLTEESEDSQKIPGKFVITSTQTTHEHHSAIAQCRLSSNKQIVASCDVDGVVKLWSVNGISSKTYATIISKSHFQALEWLNYSELLLLGASDGLVRLYDSTTRQTVQDVSLSATPKILNQIKVQPYANSFATSCISDDRSNSLDAHSKLNIWNIGKGQITIDTTIPLEETSHIMCMCYNEGGTILAFGDSKGNVTLYNTGNYKVISTKKMHNGPVYCLQFSDNAGKQICSMGSDGKLKVWDILGHNTVNLPIHVSASGPFEVTGYSGYKQINQPLGGQLFDFHAKGQHIITCAGNSSTIYEVDVGGASLTKHMAIDGHRTPVLCVDWSSLNNVSYCLCGSMDGQLSLTTLEEI